VGEEEHQRSISEMLEQVVTMNPNYRPLVGNPQFTELANRVGSGVASRGWNRLESDGVYHTATSPEP
jgi:hypothetical protein